MTADTSVRLDLFGPAALLAAGLVALAALQRRAARRLTPASRRARRFTLGVKQCSLARNGYTSVDVATAPMKIAVLGGGHGCCAAAAIVTGGFLGRDLRQGPRTLEALGLGGLNRAALQQRLHAGE
jgi:hypothetical protein